jgi:hypothetical protein
MTDAADAKSNASDLRTRHLSLASDDWKRRDVLAPYYGVSTTYFNALTINNEDIQRVVLALTYACEWHDLEAVEERSVVEHLQTTAQMPYTGVPDREFIRRSFTDTLQTYAWAVHNITWHMFSEPNPIFVDCDISPDLHFNRAWYILLYVKHHMDTLDMSTHYQIAGAEPLPSVSSTTPQASKRPPSVPDLMDWQDTTQTLLGADSQEYSLKNPSVIKVDTTGLDAASVTAVFLEAGAKTTVLEADDNEEETEFDRWCKDHTVATTTPPAVPEDTAYYDTETEDEEDPTVSNTETVIRRTGRAVILNTLDSNTGLTHTIGHAAWTLLSDRTLKCNLTHLEQFPSETAFTTAMQYSRVRFAPCLEAILQSKTPPTIDALKAIPKTYTGKWVVYVLSLEKQGKRPKGYVGSSTNSNGASSRLQVYEKSAAGNPSTKGMSRRVAAAIVGGWRITHIGILCHVPVPGSNNTLRYRSMILVLETVFSLNLGMMDPDCKTPYPSHLCSWNRETFGYDGLCGGLAMHERTRQSVKPSTQQTMTSMVTQGNQLYHFPRSVPISGANSHSLHPRADGSFDIRNATSGSVESDNRFGTDNSTYLDLGQAYGHTDHEDSNEPLITAGHLDVITPYLVIVSWKLLSTIPVAYKNSLHDTLFPTIEALGETFERAQVQFSPMLLAMLQSTSPPTIDEMATLPSNATNLWIVYVIILEKKGARPKVYVGSGTKMAGIAGETRLQEYDGNEKLSAEVLAAIQDKYKITHKRVLCGAPVPRPGRVYLYRALILLLENALALAFGAVHPSSPTLRSVSPAFGNSASLLCNWNTVDQEYDGLCYRFAVTERILSSTGRTFTPNMVPFMEAVETNHEVRKVDQRRIRANRRGQRIRALQHFYCSDCKVACVTQWALDKHNRTQAHKDIATHGRPLSKLERDLLEWKPRCDSCEEDFATVADLRNHNTAQHGPQGANDGWCHECSHDYHDSRHLTFHQTSTKHLNMVAFGRHTTWGERMVLERRFACHHCGRCHGSQHALECHEMSHTDHPDEENFELGLGSHSNVDQVESDGIGIDSDQPASPSTFSAEWTESGAIDKDHAANSQSLYCIPCKKENVSQSALRLHNLSQAHIDRSIYGRRLSKPERALLAWEPRCDACGEDFASVGDLRDHNTAQHGPKGGKHGWCYECSHDYLDQAHLAEHRKTSKHLHMATMGRRTTQKERMVLEQMFACDYCGTCYPSQKKLGDHKITCTYRDRYDPSQSSGISAERCESREAIERLEASHTDPIGYEALNLDTNGYSTVDMVESSSLGVDNGQPEFSSTLDTQLAESEAMYRQQQALELQRQRVNERQVASHRATVDSKRFYCVDCKRGLASQAALDKHCRGQEHTDISTYGRRLTKFEREWFQWEPRCVSCEMDFTSVADLRRHNTMRHRPLGAHNSWCHECSHDYKTVKRLAHHQTSAKHLNMVTFGRHTTAEERIVLEQRFACYHCGLCHVSQSKLNDHEACHVDQGHVDTEKPLGKTRIRRKKLELS